MDYRGSTGDDVIDQKTLAIADFSNIYGGAGAGAGAAPELPPPPPQAPNTAAIRTAETVRRDFAFDIGATFFKSGNTALRLRMLPIIDAIPPIKIN